MKRRLIIAVALAPLGLFELTWNEASAQQVSFASQDLYGEIRQMDAALSDAFNAHDINTLKRLFAGDLEFYQDNEGLAGYEVTMKDFQSMNSLPSNGLVPTCR